MKRKTAKETLAESFHELADTIPIDKITVKEIAENCGYSTATFYRHFQDKYDLIAWYYASGTAKIMDKIGVDGYTWEETLTEGAHGFYEHRKYLANLFLHTSGMDSFVRYMTEIHYEALKKHFLQESGRDGVDQRTDMYLRLYCMGTVSLTCEWILGKYEAAPEELAEVYRNSLPLPLHPYLLRSGAKNGMENRGSGEVRSMTKVFFVRHAEPDYNNHDDMLRELTPRGMEDRKLVTAFLLDQQIDIVISSPFKRAVDTVADFAEKSGLPIEIIDDFRERKIDSCWIEDFSEFTKRQWSDFTYKRSDGECLKEVQDRNIAALKAVLKKYPGKNIVIGSHGTALSTVIHYFDPSFGYDDFEKIKNRMPWIVELDLDEHAKCMGMNSYNIK